MSDDLLHRISIVIPVYAGEKTLPALLAEIAPLTTPQRSPSGNDYKISEVILVHDCGRDRSDLTIDRMTAEHAFAKAVWLSRNFGQHPATMAGMANASGDWVVTMDEDGQQDARDIGTMLDLAIEESLQLVYAKPKNPPPHGAVRNFFSKAAKEITKKMLGSEAVGHFNSFRLIDGEMARTLAAYCNNGVYLDVGLYWMVGRIGHCPINLREEMDRPSSYNYVRLFGHFWRLVLTTGTRPLRLITIAGACSIAFAIAIGAYVVFAKLRGEIPVPGWASLFMANALFSGAIMMSLGVIAEYLSVTMGIAMGKPLYVVATKPTRPARTRA